MYLGFPLVCGYIVNVFCLHLYVITTACEKTTLVSLVLDTSILGVFINSPCVFLFFLKGSDSNYVFTLPVTPVVLFVRYCKPHL